METEYKCSECKKQLTTKEVNINDDFGAGVGDYICCQCFKPVEPIEKLTPYLYL